MAKKRRRWRVAAIQMTSTADIEANCRKALRWIRQAAEAGAELIALPENFAHLRPEGTKITFKEGLDGELVSSFRREAERLGCYLLLGSVPEAIPRSRKIYNSSVLIGPDGDLAGVYRKMHLFDIKIRGGAVFQESKTVAPGPEPVVVDTPLGPLGLSICYDLRFPEIYRRMALAGARVLFVPAAFTAYTGRFHWRELLRARAIENQCWVVAPAQVGKHAPGRESHGETMVIDAWGEVVACLPRRQGWIDAEIDFVSQDKVRKGLPCLDHARAELLGF